MASLTTELLNTLNLQNEVFEKLIKIGLDKKECIIKNDVVKLQSLVAKENTLVGQNIKLDKKRQEIFKDIAFVLNKKVPITLLEIIELIKGQADEENIKISREKGIKLLDELKKINDNNKDLINISLEQIEFSINFIRGSIDGTPYYYDSTGSEIDLQDKKLFDARQ